ncbi:MAG: insulinase family protein [Opitutaceae bacterium]
MFRFRAALILVPVIAGVFFGCRHVSEPPAAISNPSARNEVAVTGVELTPDPAVLRGRIENGLRYAILPARNPQQRVSVCLLVQAGSFHERDDEPSYAHFVEHMAFRDTRDFPGDSAIQTLQKLGVAFGAHVNATTGQFETDYRFNHLPTDDPTALPTGLKILRSMADGVLFHKDAVKHERGVILSESRAAGGEIAGAWQSQLEFLASEENPRWPELTVLYGKDHLVQRGWLSGLWGWNTANAAKLRAFYDRWYRPERMILTIVGDVTPAAAQQLVRDTFSSLRARAVAGSPAPIENLPVQAKPAGPPVFVARQKFEPSVRVALSAAQAEAGPDTPARRHRSRALGLALGMLDRRLTRLSERADTPFTDSDTLVSHLIPHTALHFIRADAPPRLWSKALLALDTELRRACELGFSHVEFQQILEISKAHVATVAASASDRSSSALARSLAFAVARGVVVTSVPEDFRSSESLLAVITAEECRSALREAFRDGAVSVSLSGTFSGRPPTASQVEQLLRENRRAAPVAYVAPAPARPFPFTDFGLPGQIVKRERDDALGAELVQFANGVRLNLKRTSFSRHRVHSVVRFGDGSLSCPVEKPGLDLLAFAWIFGGLKDLPREEERAALGGGLENYSLALGATDFRWDAAGDASNLRLRLQHCAAYFVRPEFSEDVLPRAREFAGVQLASSESTASGVAQKALSQRIFGEVRQVPTIADVRQRTLEEFKTWFVPQLAGPVEITLVGDFDPETAIDAVARTFGALPPRTASAGAPGSRAVTFPPKPFSDSVPFTGKKGSAVVALVWPAVGFESLRERLGGEILAKILWDRVRLKLRAEMGATYSPATQFSWDDNFSPAIAYLSCTLESAPGHRNRVATAARLMAETLAREGATEEEFERARRPLLREAETGWRNNAWWLEVLADAQAHTPRAVEKTGALDDLKRITLAETNALARRIFVKERQSQLIVLPK